MSNNASTKRSQRWVSANRDRRNRYMKEYRSPSLQAMLGDINECWFVRDARKRKELIQATPPWADLTEIRRIYQKCEELNQRYPTTGFVVHHIIPIAHTKICGLHVPENLKVVSMSVKRKLGRKFS